MKSLTARYITVSFVGIATAFIVSAILLHSTISNIIAAEFDSLLVIKAKTIADMIEIVDGKPVAFTLDSSEFPVRDRFHQPQFFEIYTIGTLDVFARSRNLGDFHLRPECQPHSAPLYYRNIELPDHSPGRQLSYLLTLEGEAPLYCIVVAKNSSEIGRVLEKVDAEILVWGGSSLVILLPLIWIIVTSSLRPIRKLSSQIENIDVKSFATRIDPQGVPEELLVVVSTLNTVLEKMKETFERERTFVSNAAHDLRTPLSGLRAILDVTSSRPRTGEEYKIALNKCQSIVDSLGVLLASLLTLARLEDGVGQEEDSSTDLVTLVRDSMSAHQEKITRKNVDMQWVLPSEAIPISNAYRIRLVVDNLFDNAVSYVNQGGTIRCSLKKFETTIFFELSNSGASLTDDQLARVFDRFWRADSSREQSEEHHGLGLSIVQQSAASIGGTVRCVCREGDFIVTVQIPLGPIAL